MKNILKATIAVFIGAVCLFNATAQNKQDTVTGKITQITLKDDAIILTLETGTVNLPLQPGVDGSYLTPDGNTQEITLTQGVAIYSGWDSKPKRNMQNCTLQDLSSCLNTGRLVTVFKATDPKDCDCITLLPEHKYRAPTQNYAPAYGYPPAAPMPYAPHHSEPHHKYYR